MIHHETPDMDNTTPNGGGGGGGGGGFYAGSRQSEVSWKMCNNNLTVDW